jgi:hypothetical protein
MLCLHRIAALTILAGAVLMNLATADTLSPAPEGTFTVALIPDTQRYLGPDTGREGGDEVTNPAFTSRTSWIAENLDAQRIVFVSHMGDITDRNDKRQWEVARACMDQLHGKVPYGISVGNHDFTDKPGGEAALFQKYFGAERFAGMPWYGASYGGHPDLGPAVSGNNGNSYQLFPAEGLDFILLHLECNAPDDVLAWADSVLETHRDRLAIITTHMYLGGIERKGADEPQGRMQWKKVHGERGNTPEQLWEKCFSKQPNLLLVLCGDQSASITHYQSSTGSHGNTVHEILTDYPRDADDSDWIRLLRFHSAATKIEVITYSPTQDTLCESVSHKTARDDHQFELDISGAIAAYQGRKDEQP